MLNRFNGCKSLADLYKVFEEHADKVLEFNNLSEEELTTVASVFNSNVEPRDAVDELNENGYTYVWNYVVSIVEGREEQEDKDMMNNNANETINNATQKEGKVMKVKNNVDAAVQEMMGKFQEAKENIKVQAGETKEEFIERTDESLNIMKDALGNTLGVLDDLLGYSVLKNSILDMMEASMTNGSSKKDLFKMARKCRELIEAEIENLEFWADEDSLKKAVQLKSLVEDERGKSIFESFTVGVIWIAKKVARKLRKWFKVDEEKSIIGSICRAIGTFAKVLRAGVKIAWNAVKFAASFVISGVVIVADWLVRTIKTVVEKIKSWSTEKLNKVTEEDVIDDEDEIIDEEDEAGVFGTNLA